MSQPFYLPPARLPTSAEIMEEARRCGVVTQVPYKC